MPGAHGEKHFVAARVLRFDRFVDGHRAVDVFLVPEAVHQHGRNFQRLRGENLVHRLLLPPRVVCRMIEKLAPEADLLKTMTAAEFAGRTGLQVQVVIIVVAGPPVLIALARGFLVVDVGHVQFAKGAVVKPVVAHPAVHHGVHRHGDFERGMGIDECHQGQKSIVGNAEDADLAVALRNIFHQPFDGVVGVGGMIDRCGIQRAAQRARHHIVALGAVLAADVLDNADVAAFKDDFQCVVIAMEAGSEMRAVLVGGEIVGVVRRAGKKNWRVLSAFGHKDDSVQLHAVAHRNHHFAPGVVEAIRDGCELGRRFAGQRGRSRRRRSLGQGELGEQESAEHWHEQG